MTKAELREYRWIMRGIDQQEEQLAVLDSRAQRMTTRLSHAPGCKGKSDEMVEVVLQIVGLQDEINRQLSRAYAIRREIEQCISALSFREQYLIRARYIEGKTWDDIAHEMDRSWSHIHRMHGDALQKLRGRD